MGEAGEVTLENSPLMPTPSEESLDQLLTEPPPQLIDSLRRIPGDILVLGVSGKMGVTLARLARRAADAAGLSRKIIGVSRFTSGDEAQFQRHGVETIGCDLLDEAALARLPAAPNVVFLAARKFGSTGDESTTWAMNAVLPAIVCRRFCHSRIVALSTGNVYPLVRCDSGGSRECDQPQPIGEYAMSCLAKERIFEHFSRTHGTPVAIVRLNYACDLRYGVLVDIAENVWRGVPVDVTMGYFNTIWQGDACAMALRALEHTASPPWIVNLTGADVLTVRTVAEQLGRLMNKPVRVQGTEAATALLSDASRGIESLGPLRVASAELIERVAHWVLQGGRTLNKPTHFEVRDGQF
jgi:nucleoside-diphosphate-sugar epimerase